MFKSLVLSSIVLLFAGSSAKAALIISEILADPASGIAGDANGDGTGSSTQDEFVEFFNDSLVSMDIFNWYLSDATVMRHVFPVGTIVPSYQYLVVFGGGSFTATTLKEKASTGGLSLNNMGDSVKLYDSGNNLIEEVIYNSLANQDQSIVRPTPLAGESFLLHSQVSFYEGKSYSSGFGPVPVQVTSTSAVPEPASMSLLGLGIAGLGMIRRKNT